MGKPRGNISGADITIRELRTYVDSGYVRTYRIERGIGSYFNKLSLLVPFTSLPEISK